MKTTDLIDQVADKAGIARDAARLAVDVMLTSIVDAAKQGEEVSLPGFGKFKVKDKFLRVRDAIRRPVRRSRSRRHASLDSRQRNR